MTRAFLLALCGAISASAQPRLLLNADDLERIEALSTTEAWAARAKAAIVNSADTWPKRHLDRYGLSTLELPAEGGQWYHHYVCPVHGVRLEFRTPNINRCPVDGRTFSGWPYDQVVFSNRHDEMATAARDLALSWRFTGNKEYAEKAIWILDSYAQRYLSYPLHDTNNRETRSGARVHPQTLDESIWLIPMAWAYDLLRDSELITPEVSTRVEQLLRETVRTIERNDTGISNWQSWHNAAIAAAGFTLGDDALIAQAIDGKSGFRFQMKNSVVGEGFWYEGAWSYHFYALDALMQTAEMAARNGIDLWSEEPKLSALYAVPLRLTFADGSLPAFNDSNSANIVNYDGQYEVAWRRTGDEAIATVLGRRTRARNALLWGDWTIPEPSPKPLLSEVFPDSGFATLRSETNDHAVIVKFGPHGGGHGHYDKLNFVSFARGGILGVDPGTQSYAAPTHNTWDKMTVAHNTLVVDEQRQNEATGKLLWFESGPGFSAASADAGAAYRNVQLTRTMLVTPEYALDMASAQSTDGAPHLFDWVYHNAGTVQTKLDLQPWSGFGQRNGYQHLTNNRSAATSGEWSLTFEDKPSVPRAAGSVYASVPAARGRSEITDEQKSGGSYSLKLSYELPSTSYLLFTTTLPQSHRKPEGLRVMIHGDGSRHRLSLRLSDASDERFVATVGPIDWTGWKAVEVSAPETWTRFLGNNDGKFDTPAVSMAVQIDYSAGGPASGAVYIDDLTVLYGPEDTPLTIDFELPHRSLRVSMLGAADTTVVTGNGLGPNLRQPVPYVLARRSGTEATFTSVLEPFGNEPAVTSFRELSPGVVEIVGREWTDTIRLTGSGVQYQRR